MLPELNFPAYKFKIKAVNGKTQRTQIFDRIRKKYIALTPEEWVRQHIIHYLIEEKKYPESLISVESKLKYNQLTKRSDIIVYNTRGTVEILVECKSYDVTITPDTFDQAARYNMQYKATYMVLSNGMQHYCCKMDYAQNTYVFLENIPEKT